MLIYFLKNNCHKKCIQHEAEYLTRAVPTKGVTEKGAVRFVYFKVVHLLLERPYKNGLRDAYLLVSRHVGLLEGNSANVKQAVHMLWELKQSYTI